MSALQEIHQWFSERPDWQWQAYQRIFHNEPIDQAFIKKLADLCEKDAVGKTEIQPHSNKIDEGAGTAAAVNILGIEDVQNINSLAPGQKLSFGPTSLTVVYGDNGAGKTGYGRILRQVCRSRGGAPRLLGNIYSEDIKPGSATVRYSVNNVEDAVNIQTNASSSAPLQSFSIFDRQAASVLVEKDNEAAFRPFGLDILDKFTRIADDVKAEILRRNSENSQPLIDSNLFPENTVARTFITQLNGKNARTQFDKVVSELSSQEQKRIVDLEEVIAKIKNNDPRKLATACRAQATRFQKILDRVQELHTNLSAFAVESAIELKKSAKKAQQASADAREKAFTDAELKGIGQESWKALWEAARAFSEQAAYPGKVFPHVEAGAQCVLCLQPLSDKASTRLQSLEDFVKGSLQAEADKLKRASDKLIAKLETYLPREQDGPILEELESDHSDCGVEIKKILSDAKNLAEELITYLRNDEGSSQTGSLSAASEGLGNVIAGILNKAAEYDRLAEQGKVDELEKELSELKARHLLFEKRAEIQSEIARFEKVKILAKAAQSANTMSVSQFSNGLTTKYVSEALCMRFKNEITALGLTHIRVDLASAGARKGVTRHKIKLESIQPANPEDVISEGEFRCLALAAFLSEIAESPSGILFDDPVCSLDHIWREKIAERLVQEAKGRQVIVFTHDMAFASLLDSLARSPRHNTGIAHRMIQRRGQAGAGFCSDQMPWVNMKTRDRRTVLNNELVRLGKLAKTGDPTYEREIIFWYGMLREAWERAIEELLFNEAVIRFRRSVETHRLKKALGAWKPTDYETIEKGMGRCSQFLPGHDHATELNPPVPTIADAESDFKEFADWTTRRTKEIN